MKPSAKRALSLLASAAFLAAAFGIYGIFIRPAYDEILLLRGELRSKDQFLREQSLAIGRVNDLILQYQGTGRLQDTISLSYPLKEDLSAIFSQLRALASVNGLSIEIFGVKPLALKELVSGLLVRNTGSLALSLRLNGSYEAFRNFINGVETNVRVMDTQQFTIEPLGSPGSNLFAYNITINTYYQSNE